MNVSTLISPVQAGDHKVQAMVPGHSLVLELDSSVCSRPDVRHRRPGSARALSLPATNGALGPENRCFRSSRGISLAVCLHRGAEPSLQGSTQPRDMHTCCADQKVGGGGQGRSHEIRDTSGPPQETRGLRSPSHTAAPPERIRKMLESIPNEILIVFSGVMALCTSS
jgi:hypothetical protein